MDGVVVVRFFCIRFNCVGSLYKTFLLTISELIMQDITTLQQQATEEINKAQDIASLDSLRVAFLGKKGKLTDILKNLVNVPVANRPIIGEQVNKAKREINNLIEDRLLFLKEKQLQLKISKERIDVTLPGRDNQIGSLHPILKIKQIINEYFSRLGFDIVTGPEIETEFYNFEALNIPSHHPARAMHDTFYFGDGLLLRTHTSPVQVRILEKSKPPLRLIAPGRVYRCDSDLTHTPMFHQVEGLVIDSDSNLASLKGLLANFFANLFGRKLAFRFRPSYFPFTEPSAEMDIECTKCSGDGCRICKFSGWLEVGGCGMVHPNVLRAVNLSPDEYQGWAFGMGIDRIAMLYYGIDDLRMMFENEIAFLKQF